MLVHLPREEGYRHKETPKNGPALAGYGALTMKNALTNTMSSLPTQLARSLTWERGKEMSAHAQLKVTTGIPVFFADPSSVAQTRMPTDSCANNFLRAQISHVGQLKNLRPSLTHSTHDLARPSAGRHQRKPSTSTYYHFNKQVLLPPVELAQRATTVPPHCCRGHRQTENHDSRNRGFIRHSPFGTFNQCSSD